MAFSTTITLGGLPCLLADPQKYPAAAKKANSYWCPLGPEPGRAWVLMTRASVTSLNKDAALSLVMTHGGDITRTNTFQGLYFVSAKRLLRGGPGDNNAAYLVELEDVRRIAKASSVTAQYNVRAWSMKGDYLDATINDGDPWTWQEIVDDLWGKLPSVVGSSPTLPYTPHGTPEGFQFMGMSAWAALHQVLAKLYCTTAYHPTTGAFSIVSLGASQSGVESISAAITHDLEPFAEAAHVIPQYVRVHFNTHHEAYGQERDTEENSNWVTSRSSYKVDVATEHAGAIAGTCVDVWDDLAAVYNDSDTLDNQSALEDRADEVAAKWLQDALTANRHRMCVGIDSSILPGSQIRAVLWRNWGESLGSSATEYISHPGLPRPYDGGDMDGEATLPAMRLQAPDIGRASFPVYPRIINAIEITGPGASGKEPGDELDPDDSDMWEGSIKRYVGKQIVTLGSVKVLCPEYDSGKPKLKLGQVVLGRLSGSQDKGGEEAGERESIYLAELPSTGGGGSYTAGCGIEISSNKISTDTTALAGVGLKPAEEGCALDIDYGCGLSIENGYIRFSNISVDGDGLKADLETCHLHVDPGCGLMIDEDDKVAVDVADLAGDGLKPSDDALEGKGCELTIDYGCGLTISEGKLAFDASQVVSDGLEVDDVCKIKLSPGVAEHKVEVVTDVECNEEGGWDVTTAILKFDANGLFVGTE